MPSLGRFERWFTGSELLDLNTAYSGEYAVLVLEPATFAFLGRLSELVFYSRIIFDDISSGPEQLEMRDLKQRIYSQMGYSYDITQKLDQIIATNEDRNARLGEIRDSLNSDDGSIADVLWDLLPVLLAGNAEMQAMGQSLGAMQTSMELVGENTTQSAQAASQQVELSISTEGLCCGGTMSGDPTAGGVAEVYAPSVSCNDMGDVFTEDSIGMTTSLNGSNQLILTPTGSGSMQYVGSLNVANGVHYVGSFDLEFSDGGVGWYLKLSWNDDVVIYEANSSGNISIPIDANSPPSGANQLIIDLQMSFSYEAYLGMELCADVLGSGKPQVILDLGNGIGEVKGGLMRGANAWIVNAFGTAEAEIESTIQESVEQVQIDWTRPISGTLTVEVYDGLQSVETYDFDMSDGRAGVVDFVSDQWDSLKVKIKEAAGQALGDLVVWAYRQTQ